MLALLATDKAQARDLLITGGAQGLAQVALDGSAPARAMAAAALDTLAPSVCGSFLELMRGPPPSPLLRMPLFWTESMAAFLSPKMALTYPQLAAMPDHFFFHLFHLCALLVLRQPDAEEHIAVQAIKEVLEALENENAVAKWLATIFPEVVARSRADIDAFDDLDIGDFPDIGHLGMEVTHLPRVRSHGPPRLLHSALPSPPHAQVTNRVRGMALAEKALKALYQRYLREVRAIRCARGALQPSLPLRSPPFHRSERTRRAERAHDAGAPLEMEAALQGGDAHRVQSQVHVPRVAAQGEGKGGRVGSLGHLAPRHACPLPARPAPHLPHPSLLPLRQFFEHLNHGLEGKPKELFAHLVKGAFDMYHGLVDQKTLAETDFLDNPQALIKVVRDGAVGADERVQLLAEIAARYMQTYVDQEPPQLPLTPHHTQICAMLIFSQFYEQKQRWADEYGMRAAILQMKTGEGKSIVIAMLAIYTVKQLGKRVHVLENNEGLLERDFASYKGFYESFGLTCNKTIDSTSDICYCLKKQACPPLLTLPWVSLLKHHRPLVRATPTLQNNLFFNQHILAGDLDLSETILIVDEVDDLVVNEKPTLLYQAKDDSLTPHFKACYTALMQGKGRPPKQDNAIWNDAKRIKKEADSKELGVHYQQGEHGWIMLEEGPDGTPRLPKVPLSDDWLIYKNYEDFGVEPTKNTFRNCLCTPYMYSKYSCIFGLTGSVGGEAERAYIAKTYQAVPYEVPLSL